MQFTRSAPPTFLALTVGGGSFPLRPIRAFPLVIIILVVSGALDGGYRDPDRSKMMAFRQSQDARAALDGISDDLQRESELAGQADSQVTVLMGEVEKMEVRRTALPRAASHRVPGLYRAP